MIVELYSLGPTYVPDQIIENWYSLVWTERYAEAGEFELKTSDIEYTLARLPLASFVTVSDSNHVMYVETHAFETLDDGTDILTVSGRSATIILGDYFGANRWFPATGKTQIPDVWTLPGSNRTPSQAALYMIQHAALRMHQYEGSLGLTANPFLAVTNQVPASTATRKWIIEVKDLYSQVFDALNAGYHGLRSVWGSVSNKITIQIYDGLDRSTTQTDRTPVILSWDTNDLNKSNYVNSIAGLKTNGFFATKGGMSDVYDPERNPHGHYRFLLIPSWETWDGGSNGSSAELNQAAASTGKSELDKYKETKLHSFEVSQTSQNKLGEDYLLGDIVSMIPKYGDGVQRFRLTEVIRTFDDEGEKVVPSFSDPKVLFVPKRASRIRAGSSPKPKSHKIGVARKGKRVGGVTYDKRA